MMATTNAFMPHLYQSSHYQSHHEQTQQSPSRLHAPLWQSIPRSSTSSTYPAHNGMSAYQNSQPTPQQHHQQQQGQQQTTALVATGKKRKRLQRACVACHKAKRRCDGGLPCSNCDFSGRTCAYSDSQGKAVPPTKRTLRPSEAALQEQKTQQNVIGDAPAGRPIASSQSPSSTSSFTFQPFSVNDSNPSGFGGVRWTSQLDLAWSAIHTFADAASMMMGIAKEEEGKNESVQLPLTVAHNLAVILERMNEQHALITEHMTAMGVAMLKTSCSAASEASSSHHDHHAWSDLERRSDRLQMEVRMDPARLAETQKWLSNGGTEAYRQKDTGCSSSSSSSSRSQQRSTWSTSPPTRSRTSLSPIQAPLNGQNNSMLNMPPLKSRHSSTSSSTTNGSSVMTIGHHIGQEQAPFLPPLSGLNNGKSNPHTLPPLRFPSPPNAEESTVLRRTCNESNGNAKWTPLSTHSHGSMYERMRA